MVVTVNTAKYKQSEKSFSLPPVSRHFSKWANVVQLAATCTSGQLHLSTNQKNSVPMSTIDNMIRVAEIVSHQFPMMWFPLCVLMLLPLLNGGV